MHDAMNSHIDSSLPDDPLFLRALPKSKAPATLTHFSDAIRQPLIEFFTPKFNKLLDEIPGWVIERCDSLPAPMQQRYMEIIPELRRSRTLIEQNAVTFMDTQLHRFTQLEQVRDSKLSKLPDVDFEHIGLVDAADFEVAVAVDALADRLAHALEPELGNAFQRLKRFTEKLSNQTQLPFHPRALFQVLLDSLAPLSLLPAQRISLVRHFAIQLDLPALHELKALILPALEYAEVPERDKFQPNKSTATPEKPKAVAAPAGQAQAPAASVNPQPVMPPPIMEDGIPILHVAPHGGLVVDPTLLIQQAKLFAAMSKSIASTPLQAPNPHPFANEQVLDQPELLSLLGQLQSVEPRTPMQQSEIQQSVAAVRDNIRQNLHSDAESTQVIAENETNLIDLVSTLFDYILDDKELPTAMKALIGRLQIPILKVALVDKSFFSGEDHPARKLLNLLAKAGQSWDENSKSSEVLYKKVEEVVFVVLTEFHDEISIFERLLNDFQEFYQQQQDRLAAMDARTREAEENRARAEAARTLVQQALNRRLNGLKLPMSIVKLLQEGWRHVLYLSALKEGTESESWRQSIKVVDALIWSMLPPAGDVQWIERLKGVSPKLLNSLRKGLMSVNFDTQQLEKMLAEILQSHQEIINGVSAPLVEVLDPENKANAKESAEAITVQQAMSSTHPNEIKFVAMPVAQVASIYEGDTLSPNDPHVVEVRHLVVGTWVEFLQSDSSVRHRLVAKIRSSEKLIFANKRGIKAAELSMMQLAIELSQNRAAVLTEQPQMFDRALLSVVDGLRKLSA